MTINLSVPNTGETPDLKPRITVIGVGGAGCNAVNNMIESHLEGVDFVVANTDAQAITHARTDRRIQLGMGVTKGLGAGSRPDIGRSAAQESLEEILEHLKDCNMVFITAGMGGGTGTGAAPVIAKAAREHGILTVGVVTKPFQFEGKNRMRIAEQGIEEMQANVDTLIIIPNQNLFRVANEKTTFADAFKMADDVLYQGVRGITDLMVMPGLINLDFADVEAVMSEMGKAMMGTGEAVGERRATEAAEAAISNPLLEDTSIAGARGVLINITGGLDMTLFEVDEAANLIRDQVDADANIIFGSTFDEKLEGKLRVSVVATGIDSVVSVKPVPRQVGGNVLHAVGTKQAAAPAAEQRAPAPAPAPRPVAETVAAVEAVTVETPMAIAAAPEPAPAPVAAAPRPAIVAAPGSANREPFIPPRPASPMGEAAPRRADPFAAAAMANAPKPQAVEAPRPAPRPAAAAAAPERGPSLFERVTGTGRARTEPQQVAHLKPVGMPRPAARPEAAPAAEPAKAASVSATERLPGTAEDDLLDIPAFLRRQSN